MAKSLSDLVCWITGASSGIGRAVALEMSARGAHVAVSARRADRLEEVVAEIKGNGGRALAVVCDVTDEDAMAAAAERVVAELGGIDIALANAGFGVSGRVVDLSADEWRRQLNVNVVGVAMTAKYAIPHLIDRKGRLALVGSVAGMIPVPGNAAYAASKYAVRAIGQSLAVELHGTGVSCTTIHPGYVESDIARVDNRGVFNAERKDPRPTKLMWPTDRAAKVMVDAIARRKREFVFTTHGKLGGFLGRHTPGLVHFAMTRSRSRARAN